MSNLNKTIDEFVKSWEEEINDLMGRYNSSVQIIKERDEHLKQLGELFHRLATSFSHNERELNNNIEKIREIQIMHKELENDINAIEKELEGYIKNNELPLKASLTTRTELANVCKTLTLKSDRLYDKLRSVVENVNENKSKGTNENKKTAEASKLANTNIFELEYQLAELQSLKRDFEAMKNSSEDQKIKLRK